MVAVATRADNAARRLAAKEARFAARFDAPYADDEEGDDHRKAASHAMVMTHHALEMKTPEAHKAAADAHRKIADLHDEASEGDEDGDEK